MLEKWGVYTTSVDQQFSIKNWIWEDLFLGGKHLTCSKFGLGTFEYAWTNLKLPENIKIIEQLKIYKNNASKKNRGPTKTHRKLISWKLACVQLGRKYVLVSGDILKTENDWLDFGKIAIV